MKPHSFDLTSFLFAVIFGGAAIAYLLADRLSWDIDGRWVLPVALIALGVAGIAGAVSSLRSTGRAGDGADDGDDTDDGSDTEPLGAAGSL